MVVTAFSEETMRDDVVYVELVQYRIGVLCNEEVSLTRKASRPKADLAQARGEYDHFVDFAHLLQEVVHTRTLDHIHIVPVILDLHRHDVICLRY